MNEPRDSSRTRTIGIVAGLVLLAFLAGFVPQWLRVRALQDTLEVAERERTMLDLGGQLGAALAESQRGNYERARQLMAGFFSELQTRSAEIPDEAARGEVQALLEQRDEVITLLSRAAPESVSRLNMMYTRYFAAVHPAGRGAAPLTPSPPP